MYTGPWHQLKNSCFVNWPKYNNELSIPDLADRLIKEYNINQNDIIIGSSLGGMVGLEILNKISPKKVFLIGSAISPSELSTLSRTLIPFSKKTLIKFSQFVASISKKTILKMYVNSETDFILSMSKAIFKWQGFKGDLKRVHRIHGKKDFLIRCPSNCKIIKDGGHLIALSHAQECVDFIEEH